MQEHTDPAPLLIPTHPDPQIMVMLIDDQAMVGEAVRRGLELLP